ncbi:type II secretion system protein [Oribacterium sp. HCP28S3_H8]|uniref:type II secretion system protein n=1 Tax=Oribacterium sp. HCP28S3_H8 TaxID=3438945 RepID=UPI003F8AFB94
MKMKSQLKKNRNKGFTLGELLIVVAIIGVLVAISIPIFTSQLEKAREATDAANIRSQYAEVMAEAITDGGDVNGYAMFGAVELKQKKNEWQSTGLKENLQGVYQSIEGDHPKAGGTAWVEYRDDQVILHYEGGSGSSGSGNAGGGSTGGGSDSGGSTGSGSTGSESTGGGNTGSGSGGNTGGSLGGGSGANSDPQGSGVLSTITSKATELQGKPQETDNTDYNIKISKGNIYTYKGETYIAKTDTTLVNKYNWPTPDTSQGQSYYVKVGNNKVLTSADSSNGRDLPDTEYGDIYKTDDGELYLFVAQGNYIIPSDGDDKWVKINLNS